MSVWLASLGSVVGVSALSLVGLATLSWRRERVHRLALYLVSLAVGALLGDAFIHLIPAAFDRGGDLPVSLFIMVGMLAFFVLEKILRAVGRSHDSQGTHVHPAGVLNLVTDGLHNFIDGILIGASYLVSLPLGLATTMAVALHEIPQELGDFGVLVHSGFTVRRAVFLNLLSALTAVLGAFLALALGSTVTSFSTALLPMTAGGFIYLAAADLVPELQRAPGGLRSSVGQLALIVTGIALMAVLALVD